MNAVSVFISINILSASVFEQHDVVNWVLAHWISALNCCDSYRRVFHQSHRDNRLCRHTVCRRADRCWCHLHTRDERVYTPEPHSSLRLSYLHNRCLHHTPMPYWYTALHHKQKNIQTWWSVKYYTSVLYQARDKNWN